MLMPINLNHIICLNEEGTPAKNILRCCKYNHFFNTRNTHTIPTKTAVPPR